MSNVYIFNPDNDLALANFSGSYTAPANAIRLAEAGSLLPFLWTNQGDAVIVPEECASSVNRLKNELLLEGEIYQEDRHKNFIPIPWGWSPALVSKLKSRGIDEQNLPRVSMLESIRRLSHRRISTDLNRFLKKSGIPTPPIAQEILSIEEVDFDSMAEHPVMMKAPWSNSGRGVLASDAFSPCQFRDQMRGMIRHQGSVMIEQKLNRIVDFAMLFEVKNGKASFKGLSVFKSASTGEYLGNIIAPQDRLVNQLTELGAEHSYLNFIAKAVSEGLSLLVGHEYTGPVGVDMMIYTDDSGKIEIAPCIEINLRMTMGFVALALSSRHLSPGSEGILSIQPATDLHNSFPIIKDGRLESGDINLSPTGSVFTFHFSAKKF